MKLSPQFRPRRAGFTLVEVLVAAGLCMLIMVVITQAFAAATDTLRLLKATGDLQERLASAESILRADLQATHLEDSSGEPVRVSQVRFDLIGQDTTFARPMARGFLRIQQERVSVVEGSDTEYTSSVAGGNLNTGHILSMAVKRAGTRSDRAFTTRVSNVNLPASGSLRSLGLTSLIAPGVTNQFVSQWAEVSYFLTPMPTGNAGATQLYTLVRRERLLTATDNTNIDWANTAGPFGATPLNFPGISNRRDQNPAVLTRFLNGPGDITNPNNRLGRYAGSRSTSMTAYADNDFAAVTGTAQGSDLLLSNVVSFQIKASWDSTANASPPGVRDGATDPRPMSSFEYPFDDLPAYRTSVNNPILPNGAGNQNFARTIDAASALLPRVYDTWTSQGSFSDWNNAITQVTAGPPPVFNPNPNYVPLPIRLKAIQIKLRIYEPKNKLTRQMTLTQDL